MTRRIVIIADDLTGAADCGVACGAPAVVLLEKPGTRMSDAAVLAIDADTRSMAAEQAADIVADLVTEFVSRDEFEAGDHCPILLFKKVDSTLRGNVGAELAAALKARRRRATSAERVVALFAPAFPAHGRTTVGGRHTAHGQLLENADLWPDQSVRPRSDLAGIVRDSGLSCASIGLQVVRAGAHPLETAMMRLASEVDVLVCDAQSDADLDAIARAAMVLDPKTVWSGSAGLARHIPRAAGLAPCPLGYASTPLMSGPTLFVVGSPAHASLSQARALAAAPDIAAITIPPELLLSAEAAAAAHEHAQHIASSLQRGMDVLVQLDGPEPCAAPCAAEGARRLTSSLARLIAPCADHAGALVATGGETARSVLDAWRIRRLRLLGEVEPGLPCSVAEGWRRPLIILTKAGTFGTRGTLVRCRNFLQNLERATVIPEPPPITAAGQKS
jgi:4-hydroxythreonine-4-phosphate dehydrogenase